MSGFAQTKFYMYTVERFVNEAQKRFETKVGIIEAQKAAEEFKEIESMRENSAGTDGRLDWKSILNQPYLPVRKPFDLPTGQNFLARFLESDDLAQTPAAGLGYLSLEWQIRTIEKLEQRMLSDAEVELFRGAIEDGSIARLVSDSKTFKDATRRISLYLYFLKHSKTT